MTPNTLLRTRLYVDALGNAGDARGLDAVTGALDHEDEGVRAAAAHGLRFMPGDAVEARLEALASRDPSASVRRRAELALTARAQR